MSAIARDAIKFVRVFGGAIMESTPHLYISALAFSPVKSIIYTEFSPEYSNLAQIVDGGELHWPNLQLTIRGHPFTSVTFSADGKRFKVVDSFSDPHSTQNTTKVYSFEYVGQ